MQFNDLPTPCYVIDEALLEENLRILQAVSQNTGCRILLAQKAFSCYALYPLIGKYLQGTAASGLYEARLGAEEMPGGEVHVFSPAYRDEDFAEILQYADHIVFNSCAQVRKFAPLVKAAGKSCGLRVNPEFSTQEHAIYDPCSPGSRMGVRRADFEPEILPLLDGLHMHTLCEQNSDDLLTTVAALEEKFGELLPQVKWLNLGGGHHITRKDYDIAALEGCLCRLRDRYNLQIYLEPGEAVALNCGFLQTTVLDITHADMDIAILDTSAACHMPDVLEMPYRPPLLNSGLPGELAHTYRLGAPTCLAGDVIGEYSFAEPLKIGDRLVFGDMAIYSMVKNNTFNGMPLPTIAIRDKNGDCRIHKTFGYEDFKCRL
jgi:carboxynorspermidine decarboxylase